ncbi:carbon dioxide concentrating mechanism protein CcmM [Bacillus mesophilus]|uniref:Carbonate dehydratase n=1 Tax=Bacillus mesophilus TaxID=1808955 RepID=A0A6M0Q8W1_9BACI|nr:carbonate dehydratase [Bacillus mesophilus]MBM7661821.1 carbon dioxide concentrating mechanism protein CcmM [Bacillus mesophilus]NEY72816.1 carbonate dehydratase [Bacillus mesophilus]
MNPAGPYNMYTYFIGANPVTSFNPVSYYPLIDPSSYLSPFSYIVGKVFIRKNVFIGPFVSIRADEGTPFFIGSDSNLQDGVILHGLKQKYVTVQNKRFSIFIGKRVTCAHGSLIHGPVYIGHDTFVGFNAIVYNAKVEEGCFISSGAVVTNGVTLKANRFVPPGASIDSQDKADSLKSVPKSSEEFAKDVQRVNREFPPSYSLFFGETRCSCGLYTGLEFVTS